LCSLGNDVKQVEHKQIETRFPDAFNAKNMIIICNAHKGNKRLVGVKNPQKHSILLGTLASDFFSTGFFKFRTEISFSLVLQL